MCNPPHTHSTTPRLAYLGASLASHRPSDCSEESRVCVTPSSRGQRAHGPRARTANLSRSRPWPARRGGSDRHDTAAQTVTGPRWRGPGGRLPITIARSLASPPPAHVATCELLRRWYRLALRASDGGLSGEAGGRRGAPVGGEGGSVCCCGAGAGGAADGRAPPLAPVELPPVDPLVDAPPPPTATLPAAAAASAHAPPSAGSAAGCTCLSGDHESRRTRSHAAGASALAAP
mmetsp:Transcript_65590/g.179903  ORF Transcript_65590/g.179903 Transcript_65590/m.179903 type:complete len:233 (-) Transcript_65590:1628-2326(-)